MNTMQTKAAKILNNPWNPEHSANPSIKNLKAYVRAAEKSFWRNKEKCQAIIYGIQSSTNTHF